MSDAFSIATLVVGALGVCGIVWVMRGIDPRRGEDEARAFFDAYGHWPDQTREDADAGRRRLAAAIKPAEPDEHGNV